MVSVATARLAAAAPSLRHAARAQLGVASGQLAAGVGNLAFLVMVGRSLEPGPFATVAAFSALYLLVHVPVVAATAVGIVDTTERSRRARLTATAVGLAAGAAVAVAAPTLGRALDLPVTLMVALAAALPVAVPLGLLRGRLYAAGDHVGVAATLLAEPAARFAFGLPALAFAGPTGAAAGVVLGGYAALAVGARRAVAASGRSRLAAPAAEVRGGSPGRWTALAFITLAVVQNQDLVVARAVLGGGDAGRFAVLSAIGGAAVFATATVPFVLLPTARRHGRPALAVALTGAAVVGVAATLVAGVGAAPLAELVAGAGEGPAPALVAPYVAAMGCLGVVRVAAAHLAASGQRWPVVAAMVVAGAHLLALLGWAESPTSIVAATSASAAGLASVVAAPFVLRRPAVERARVALRTPSVAIVTIATIVALAVRLAVTRGLWVDEAISVSQAKLDLGQLLGDLRTTDVHPPLHHLLLWGTVRLFGDGELAVRLPSLLAGTALVPALYSAGRTLYDRRTGVIAAVLGSVAPFAVWYAQEARMYALFMLLATVATTALARALAAPTPARFAAWALAAAGMLWTQWFGILVVGVHVVAGLLAARAAWGDGRLMGRRLLLGILASSLLVIVACLPLADLLGDQLHAFTQRRAVAVAPSTAGAVAGDPAAELSVYALLANGIWAVWGYHADDAMAQITALWPLLMLGALAFLGRMPSRSSTLLMAVAAVPAAALLAAGSVKRDLFELRYFCAFVPAILLLGARALTTATRRTTTLGVSAIAVTASLAVGLIDQQLNGANPRRYDFEGALAAVSHRAQPGDVLLYEPAYLGDVIDYYAPDLDSQPLARWRTTASGEAAVFVLSTRRVADSRGTAARVGHVLAQLEEGGRRITTRVGRPNVDVWELQ